MNRCLCSLIMLGLFPVAASAQTLSVVPSAMPAEGLEIVSVAVSVPSLSRSSFTENVTVPVVAPFGIVIVVFESVKSPAVMPVPVTASETV